MKPTWTESRGDTDSSVPIVADFSTSYSVTGWNSQTEEQQGKRKPIEQHYKPTKRYKHIEGTLPSNSRTRILLKFTWNSLQGRSQVGSQGSLSRFQKLNHIKYLLQPKWKEARNQ